MPAGPLETIRFMIEQWASYPEASSRLISAIGIDVHWIILQYVVGLPFIAFIAQLIYLKTRDKFWLDLARKLVKGFVIVFAVGAATGTAAEFGLILLWPNFTEAGGKWVYFPFYAEIYAFIMEVVFVYFLYYGWGKVGDKTRLILTMLVFVGAWYSAAMIMAVNSFMVAPTGLEPGWTPDQGALYDQGYPRISVYVPPEIAQALDPEKLAAAGIVVRTTADGLIEASLPIKVTYRLFWEAANGYSIEDSILWNLLTEEAKQQLAGTPVSEVLDAIMNYTLEVYDPLLYTFHSPVWLASVAHTIGAGVVVSAYTVAGAYALRLLRGGGAGREYSLRALKFALTFAMVAIVVQGALLGHEQALVVAHYVPEKLAAIEGTTDQVISISRHILLGLPERLVAFLAYGSFNAPLPEYDDIPQDYCSFPGAPVTECRPPILVHYAYYTKVGLAVALALFSIYAAAVLHRKGELGKRSLAVLAASPVMAQLVSTLGWVVREVGRKPFTIYGIFTPAEAANPAGPDMLSLALVGIYLVVLLAVLAWAVWRFLWR